VREFEALRLAPAEQHILAEAAHALRFPDQEERPAPITADRLLTPRRRDDTAANLWATFNVIQENTIRGGIAGRTIDANGNRRRATTREVQGIDQNRALNRALWTLAERMAELKAA
jgi:hypothetical protein